MLSQKFMTVFLRKILVEQKTTIRMILWSLHASLFQTIQLDVFYEEKEMSFKDYAVRLVQTLVSFPQTIFLHMLCAVMDWCKYQVSQHGKIALHEVSTLLHQNT
ncbi:hypothetical protein Pfo_008428 [Paulownia fortunei]|nr:hypothetical protein Pfo_008428 [Paulownia fortunei]